MSYTNNVSLAQLFQVQDNTSYKADDKKSAKDAALNKAKEIVSIYDEGYTTKNDSVGKNKKVDAYEIEDEKLRENIDKYDLDGKTNSFSKKEIASYLMAMDGYYTGQKPIGTSYETNEELSLTEARYNKDRINGKFDEDIMEALEKVPESELKAKAEEIYNNELKPQGIIEFFASIFGF